MGTYTTNYNLFMPSIGEQGWGELVNNNFSTIDITMADLNTRMGTAETNIVSLTTRMETAEPIITSNTSRIGTLETETDAVDSRIKVFEDNISFDSNGNIVGNVVGNVTGNVNGYILAPYTAASSGSVKMQSVPASNSVYIAPRASGNFATFEFIVPAAESTLLGYGVKNGIYVSEGSSISLSVYVVMEKTTTYVNGTVYLDGVALGNTSGTGSGTTTFTVNNLSEGTHTFRYQNNTVNTGQGANVKLNAFDIYYKEV